MAAERRITSSRLGRLSQLGRLAGGIAGGVLSEGVRQVAQGQRPSLGELLITPDNARRLADRLSEMRGAAMKVGQLLSMDGGNLLPAEFSAVLARLRSSAHHMPLGQVAQVLKQAWGKDWDRQFKRFDFTPVAAASVGQVHRAELRDGRILALKIQYPGIRQSIDSDVDNVASLLRLSNLLPESLDLAPLLDAAKLQLHDEADYRREAEAINRFADRLAGDDRFELPKVTTELTTMDVLAMDYLAGDPIESLHQASQTERDATGNALVDLALQELFDWGLVQTDPNFANYLYDGERGVIQLLDFGATRTYPPERRADIEALFNACLENDRDLLEGRAAAVGYIDLNDPQHYRDGVIELLQTATEPLRAHGAFAFGNSNLAARMRDLLVQLRLKENYGRLPPADVLFLHRKLGGLYLLLTHLRSSVDLADLVAQRIRSW